MRYGHDLHSFIGQVQKDLSDEYDRIYSRATEDPGTAGDAAEESWAQVLRHWLPSAYKVQTKGRVISASGESSGQMDILVLSPSYPPFLLNRGYYLAPGVIAAFECKLTLKKRDIFSAVEKGAHFRRALTPEFSQYSPPLYGLLAHSHAWRNPRRLKISDKISAILREAEIRHVRNPVEVLDMLCLANLGTWTLMRLPLITEDSELNTCAMGPSFHPETDAYQSTERPVGRFLTYLIRRLAVREDNDLAALADYFKSVGLEDSGYGEPRKWPENNLPPTTPNILY